MTCLQMMQHTCVCNTLHIWGHFGDPSRTAGGSRFPRPTRPFGWRGGATPPARALPSPVLSRAQCLGRVRSPYRRPRAGTAPSLRLRRSPALALRPVPRPAAVPAWGVTGSALFSGCVVGALARRAARSLGGSAARSVRRACRSESCMSWLPLRLGCCSRLRGSPFVG